MSLIKKILKGLKWAILSLGIFFVLMLILSFTSLPYWGIHALATSFSDYDYKPSYIVLLGGAGVPSESALMRTYYTALLANQYPNTPIVIALPSRNIDSTSHAYKMEVELRVRGVRNRVLFENKGKSTRGQALNLSEKIAHNNKLLVVSAPEHIYRAVKTFRKLGFNKVEGLPAFETNLDRNLFLHSKDDRGKAYLPDVGEDMQLRYQFWNHLKFEIILLREYTAIFYYKIQGWI